MSNWRREREGTTVHVLAEGASLTLCDLDRQMLGTTVWEMSGALPSLCTTCSRKMLDATDETVLITGKLLADRGRLGEDQLARTLDTTKQSLRSLIRLVPPDVTSDLLLYARACLTRGDPEDADASVLTWRNNMRGIGLFPDGR
jgi:hypothetical protein